MAQRPTAKLRALSSRAAELARLGRHADAVNAWTKLSRLAPGDATVAAGLGAALLAAGHLAAADSFLGASCQKHRGDVALLRLHAQALIRLGHRGPAIGALYMALSLAPQDTETHADLAYALYEERSSADALAHADVALCADPSPRNIACLTNILLDLGRADDAVLILDHAIARGAERHSSLVARSLALLVVGRAEEAIKDAREAVERAPENAIARHNLAAILLQRGELTDEAWTLYDSRSGLLEIKTWPVPERRWTGGDVAGKTVLVYAEQGLGDTLQFVRYAPLVAARGARVILAVQAPLVAVLQGTPGADLVIPAGFSLPDFDVYVPLLSLPGLFATTVATIPPLLPYRMTFEGSLPTTRLQVGLVWEGNRNFSDDRKRSIPPGLLAPLGEVRGVDFHSLQFACDQMPIPGMRDAMQGVADFADTAQRIAALDLVIATDTSVAHLAATMGKPVWLLSRFHGCWRWLLGRNDSPWYPSMRVYRQPRLNDWQSVIDAVRDDLAELASRDVGVDTLAA